MMNHAFFRQDTVELARKLLGCLLIHRTPDGVTGGMIVEAEAYVGAIDKACHAYRNRSGRTEIMYHDGGYAYVYLIYGMHHCFNAVTGPEGEGNAVLIRALEPVIGLALMQQRRHTKTVRHLCSGPGKVCQRAGESVSGFGHYQKRIRTGFVRGGQPAASDPLPVHSGRADRCNAPHQRSLRGRSRGLALAVLRER